MRSIMVAMLALTACRAASTPARTAIEWQASVDIAQGGGTKGPWRQNQSSFDYVDDPSAAIAADGSVAVVWVDHRTKDVQFRFYAPDGRPRLAGPTNVSRSPSVFSWLPRVVLTQRDVLVIWQEIVFSGGSHGGEIFFARSIDGGATFGSPINLSNSIGGDGKGRITADIWHNGSLDLALAADGALYAAWTEYDGALWFTSSRDGGASFARPQLVAGTKAGPARGPSLAIAQNSVLLAWTYGENDAADVHVARLAGDRFGPPVRVATTATYSDAPKLAVDRAGTLHVAYTETTGGPFDRARIHYTRSRDGGKTFERPTELATDAAHPALAVDGTRVIVLWDVIENGRHPRGLGLAVARDGGATWQTTPLVPHSRDPAGGTNGSQQGHLMTKLAARDGAIVVVNASLAAGRGSRVWLVRGRLPP